ncbi:hypothetical protein GGI15_000740, partial [Coemansia interrupta]
CKGISKPVSTVKVKGKTASQMAEDASLLIASDIHEQWRKRVFTEEKEEKEENKEVEKETDEDNENENSKPHGCESKHDPELVARTTEYKDLPKDLKYKVDTLARVAVRTLLRKSDKEPSALLFDYMFDPTMNTDTSSGLYLCGKDDEEKMDKCKEVIELARKHVPEPFVGKNFPATFHAFLSSNAIDASIYSLHAHLPRYVRVLNHTTHTPASLASLAAQLTQQAGCPVTPVPGVPGFLSIADSSVRLSQLSNRAVLGMDVSSGIAAYALGCQSGDNVLDLCCAPGAKLLLLAELVGPQGSVTGVDVAAHRLATCRSLLAKHPDARARVRLYLADGTEFAQGAPQKGWWDPEVLRKAAAGHAAAQQPWHASKMLRSAYACNGLAPYDRVLVDAECTHDGSLGHVLKYKRLGWQGLENIAGRAADAPGLQLRLLENGWRLLRVGGTLVYSTCSLAPEQNEMVVMRFLQNHAAGEAVVEEVDVPLVRGEPWVPGEMPEGFERLRGVVRLDPRVSGCSGMFIARIRKLS